MLDEFFTDEKRGLLTIDFSRETTPWELPQYCKRTINNIVKLTTIKNIEILLDKGFKESDFFLLPESRYLHEDIDIQSYSLGYINDENIFKLDNYSKTKSFWKRFNSLERPVVCIKQNDILVPLYQHKGNTSVKLRRIVVDSPALVSIEGIINALAELSLYDEKKRAYQLDNKGKELDNMKKGLDIISKMADVTIKLNDPNIPVGIKEYLNDNLNNLIDEQNNLNNIYNVSSRKVNLLG